MIHMRSKKKEWILSERTKSTLCEVVKQKTLTTTDRDYYWQFVLFLAEGQSAQF
jgi:hypothetical protein